MNIGNIEKKVRNSWLERTRKTVAFFPSINCDASTRSTAWYRTGSRILWHYCLSIIMEPLKAVESYDCMHLLCNFQILMTKSSNCSTGVAMQTFKGSFQAHLAIGSYGADYPEQYLSFFRSALTTLISLIDKNPSRCLIAAIKSWSAKGDNYSCPRCLVNSRRFNANVPIIGRNVEEYKNAYGAGDKSLLEAQGCLPFEVFDLLCFLFYSYNRCYGD